MNNNFATLDYIVFGLYALIILGVGLWVSRNKDGVEKSSEDYFLASITSLVGYWCITYCC